MHNKAGVGNRGQGLERSDCPALASLPDPNPHPYPLIRVGYLMVLPYLLHIAVFLGYPLAFAFVLSFIAGTSTLR